MRIKRIIRKDEVTFLYGDRQCKIFTLDEYGEAIPTLSKIATKKSYAMLFVDDDNDVVSFIANLYLKYPDAITVKGIMPSNFNYWNIEKSDALDSRGMMDNIKRMMENQSIWRPKHIKFPAPIVEPINLSRYIPPIKMLDYMNIIKPAELL